MAQRGVVHLVPSFHYDVEYLRAYEDYLYESMQIVRDAIDIMRKYPEYTYLIEQTILVEGVWERCPDYRDDILRFSQEGRLAFAPGMWTMADNNMTAGESWIRQVEVGGRWLQEHLGVWPQAELTAPLSHPSRWTARPRPGYV